MKSLSDGKIILRDFIETDIEKRVYWETAETEWQKWDAPWEYETLSDEEKKKALTAYKETMGGWVKKFSELPGEEKRTGFQIVVAATGEYIGLVRQLSDRRGLQHFRRRGKMRGGDRYSRRRGAGKGLCVCRAEAVYRVSFGKRGARDLHADMVGKRTDDRFGGEARFRRIQAEKGAAHRGGETLRRAYLPSERGKIPRAFARLKGAAETYIFIKRSE